MGMSLFNITALWGKSSGGILPRRVRVSRKKSQENVSGQIQQTEEMAEQEVAGAFQEVMQESRVEANRQMQKSNFWQQFAFYGVVLTYFVAAAIFFTSLVFNTPFGLGKIALSLLPGKPHLATINLEAVNNSNEYSEGEKINLLVKLSTQSDPVEKIDLFLDYDAEMVKLGEVKEVKNSSFSLNQTKNQLSGQEIIFFDNQELLRGDYKNEVIAEIDFLVLDKKGLGAIEVNRDRSLVLKPGESGRRNNILGRVKSFNYLVK